jgi:hypothetical protein
MDGSYTEGWYNHPNLGLIKIYVSGSQVWVFQCYTKSAQKALSKERPLDGWTWALSEPANVDQEI